MMRIWVVIKAPAICNTISIAILAGIQRPLQRSFAPPGKFEVGFKQSREVPQLGVGLKPLGL